MKTNFSRREFIRTGALTAGLILVGTLSTKGLASENSKKEVTFKPVKKGRRGCSRCEKAIAGILKDPKMKKKLIELLPDHSEIYFFVRQFRSSTKVPENSIIVGNCTKALKNKAMIHVPGCTKQISKEYVFKSIVKQLS